VNRLAIVRARQARDADAEYAAIRRQDERTPRVGRVVWAAEELLSVELDRERAHILDMLLTSLSAIQASGVDMSARSEAEWLEVLRQGPASCSCKPMRPCLWHDETLVSMWRTR
jgi:hypothetical protein